MNTTEQAQQARLQAQTFMQYAQYDDLFALLRLNIPQENAEAHTFFLLHQLEQEYVTQNTTVAWVQRFTTFLQTQVPLLHTPLPKEKIKHRPRFFTNEPYSGFFIGRERELEQLHAHLTANKPTVLVNGLGGIGKTSLASRYLREYAQEYDNVVWLTQQNHFLEAFTDNYILTNNLQLAFKEETTEQRFHFIINALKQIKGRNLLVLDNFQRKEDDKFLSFLRFLPPTDAWKLLFTSREKIDRFTELNLGTLPLDEAMALFKHHCPNKNIDDTELQSLLEEVGYHTLMIELLAKIYRENTGLTSVRVMQEKIQALQIDDQILQRVITTELTQEEVRLYEYLLRVFSLEPLSAESLHILTQIAVLPAEALPIWLILLTKDEEQETYREVLENLVRKGWLAFVGEEDVQMHRLMQIVLLKALQPTYKDCEMLCYFITEILRSDEAKANPLEFQGFAFYAEALLQYINFQDVLGIKVVLQAELANFYYYAGDYTKAITIAAQNKDFALQVFGKDSQEYSTVLNNLANLYNSASKYEEALLLLQECLQIREQVLGKQHPDYAIALHNLANLYQRTNKYAEALPLYQECLQINEQVLGKQHPNYATSLNDLASLHENTEKYTEALSLYQKSLQIWEQVVGKQHPRYATSLNNLASLYQKTGKYAKALPLYQECLQICEQVLGKQHPNYATVLNNLAELYKTTGKYVEALPLYQECLQIREQVLGKQHPDFAAALYNMGRLLLEMQQIEEGIQGIFTAYQLLQENVGEEHPDTQKVKKDVEYLLQMMQKE
ncbi:MAG: ATP-binding protein [Bacteroidetes bacterium]|nr:MAG: ATP-binding protein [Bacteroidota bacterium]